MMRCSAILSACLLLALSARAGEPVITTVAGNPSPNNVNQNVSYTFNLWFLTIDNAGNIYYSEEVGNRVRRIDAATGVVTNFAGTGQGGFGGDGGPANQARIGKPGGIVLDIARNVMYIADAQNHRIRRVDMATNIITTVAGNGSGGYSGDGAGAVAARVNFPQGLAVDAAGNLYICDFSNHRIRKITLATGIISTIAGTGTAGFTGDGLLGTLAQINNPRGICVDSNNHVYFTDRANQRVRRIDGTTGIITTVAGCGSGASGFAGDNNLATSARFNTIINAVRDGAGNTYVADRVNNRIRRISAATGIITTFAGTGGAGSGGDGGQATAATLNQPTALTFSPDFASLFILELNGHCVRRVNMATNVITTVLGLGGTPGFVDDPANPLNARLSGPCQLVVNAANTEMFIADSANHAIRRWVFATGAVTTLAGTGAAGNGADGALPSQLNDPKGLAINAAGNMLYVSEEIGHRAREIDLIGNTITTISGQAGTAGFAEGLVGTSLLDKPRGLALNAADDTLYIADRNNRRIRQVLLGTRNTSTIAGIGPSMPTVELPLVDGVDALTLGTFGEPLSVYTIPAGQPDAGQLLITDHTPNFRLRRMTVGGNITTVAGTGSSTAPAVSNYETGQAISVYLRDPIDVQVDANNDLFISDQTNDRVRKVTMATGQVTTFAGTVDMDDPFGICIPKSGALNGKIVIAVRNHNRIRQYSAAGVQEVNFLSPLQRNGGFSDGSPAVSVFDDCQGVAVDSASGMVYIADRDNHLIRRLAPDGTLTTIAGVLRTTNNPAIDGNGNVATFNAPSALQVHNNILYVADNGEHRIRAIDLTNPNFTVSTVAGSNNAGNADHATDPLLATFNSPRGLYVRNSTDANGAILEIFVAEDSNHRIRLVTLPGAGNLVTTPRVATIAGTTSGFADNANPLAGQFNRPYGVLVDAAGNVYVSDESNHRVRRFSYDSMTAASSNLVTVVGTGAAGFSDQNNPLLGQLSSPALMTFEPGNAAIVIADRGNQRIRRFVIAGGLFTIAGDGNALFAGDGGPAVLGSLWDPRAVAYNTVTGDYYIADQTNMRIRRVSTTVPTLTFSATAVNGGAAPVSSTPFPVTVEVRNGAGALTPVFAETTVQLSRAAGAGNVGGTVTATILNGQSSVTFPGVTYDRGDTNVRLTATRTAGDLLNAGTSAQFNVSATAPVVTWNDPAFIIQGTALSGQQLNASANVPGTFSYTPPAGTVLAAGLQQTLQVTFTPTDTLNYTTVNDTVKIDVYAKLVTATAPTATPNPANIGESVTFNWSANVAGTVFTWDFRDGTANGTGAPVAHAFTAKGNYFVRVTATHALTAQTASEIIEVVVRDPNSSGGGGGGGGGSTPVGGGPPTDTDSDGDGFSNAIEAANGSNPNDGSSTPASLPKPIVGNTLQVDKMNIKVSFVKTNMDSLQLSGVFPVDAAYTPSNQKVFFDIGGIVKSFTLNAKGIGGDKTNALKIAKPKNGVAKYTLKLKNGSFLATLADEQIVNQNSAGERRVIKVNAVFYGKSLERDVEQAYFAKRDVGGNTK